MTSGDPAAKKRIIAFCGGVIFALLVVASLSHPPTTTTTPSGPAVTTAGQSIHVTVDTGGFEETALAGAIGAVSGSIITLLWQEVKERRRKESSGRTAVYLLLDELQANIQLINRIEISGGPLVGMVGGSAITGTFTALRDILADYLPEVQRDDLFNIYLELRSLKDPLQDPSNAGLRTPIREKMVRLAQSIGPVNAEPRPTRPKGSRTH